MMLVWEQVNSTGLGGRFGQRSLEGGLSLPTFIPMEAGAFFTLTHSTSGTGVLCQGNQTKYPEPAPFLCLSLRRGFWRTIGRAVARWRVNNEYPPLRA
jgi:hypothetical protein